MNELSARCLDLRDGDHLVLEHGKTYHVWQDDAFCLEGYYCSNSAKQHENPTGRRYSALYIKEKKQITIDGNGATLLVHGKMTPLLFDRCKDITVKNLTIDYAVPTMTEFTIVENSGGDCILRMNPDCLFRVDGNQLCWLGEPDKNGIPYWEEYHLGRGRYFKLYDPQTEKCRDFNKADLAFTAVEQIDAQTVRVRLANPDAFFPAGHVMQTRSIVRDQVGSLFQRCKNLRFENLRVKFMHGLGMVSQFCENVAFVDGDFTPAEGRTIASTADFFQFSGCRGQLLIERCRARGAQDDYINVHGTHLRVVEADGQSMVVRFMHAESWGFQAFAAGDRLEFIRWDTLIPYAETVVTAFDRLNDTDIRLWLDRPLPETLVLGKDVVENVDWTPDLTVRHCDFGPTSGRGILCTTRGKVVIEQNRFEKLWGPALLVEDDCNFWFESGCTREIIFRENEVIDCEYGHMWPETPVIRYSPKVMDEESTAFVHGKLVLTKNRFSRPQGAYHAIWLEYLREAEITDNEFDAPYRIVSRHTGKITE
ncbi:MAG: hypothetical protein IJC93_06890 [Clostridia bacterium]|nr:hypothetical protein [Clostridia bacterium]